MYYFDFTPTHNFVYSTGEMEIVFNTKLEEKHFSRFEVSPKASTVGVENLEIKEFSKDSKKLRFIGDFYVSELWFEVTDKLTGEKYETPKRKVLGRQHVTEFIKRLNAKIIG